MSDARIVTWNFSSRSHAVREHAVDLVIRKRSTVAWHQLDKAVFAPVPHCQSRHVGIPKRLRISFGYNRCLLGKLCRAVLENVQDLYALEVDGTWEFQQ